METMEYKVDKFLLTYFFKIKIMNELNYLLSKALGYNVNSVDFTRNGILIRFAKSSVIDFGKITNNLRTMVNESIIFCDNNEEIERLKRLNDDLERDNALLRSQKNRKKSRKRKYIEYVEVTGEVWKDIGNCDGFRISNIGRVMENGKILLPVLDKHGYRIVSIRRNGKTRRYERVHRLVATAFIANPNNKPEVDHINTIKTDNRVSNLRWVTHYENMFENEITLNRLKQLPYIFVKQIKHSIEMEEKYIKKNKPVK
jgi:hypothetical protein